MLLRLYFVHLNVGFPVVEYIRNVLIRCTIASIPSILFYIMVKHNYFYSSITNTMITISCEIVAIISILYIGCSKNERRTFYKFLRIKRC